KRLAHGWYQFNPKLSVRRRAGAEESWMPVYAALNLHLIHEVAWRDWIDSRGAIHALLDAAGLPACAESVAEGVQG
ncbi:MAG TPA: hypothetical protein VIG66_05895, partial [Noviherbaspirillum sp.]